MRLHELNALDEHAAVQTLLRCCGSPRWARQMAAARPFPDAASMEDAAETRWWALDRADWLEAFAAHPRIGQRSPSAWASEEQNRVLSASVVARSRLADANRDYEARFGYIFIVCATGKTADEMLVLLEGRLRHDAGDELRVAAEEQRKITRLRLEKLLEPEPDTTP